MTVQLLHGGLLELVAPGGRLLFAHHDHSDPEHARHAGFDPADYVTHLATATRRRRERLVVSASVPVIPRPTG